MNETNSKLLLLQLTLICRSRKSY